MECLLYVLNAHRWETWLPNICSQMWGMGKDENVNKIMKNLLYILNSRELKSANNIFTSSAWTIFLAYRNILYVRVFSKIIWSITEFREQKENYIWSLFTMLSVNNNADKFCLNVYLLLFIYTWPRVKSKWAFRALSRALWWKEWAYLEALLAAGVWQIFLLLRLVYNASISLFNRMDS